MFVGEFEQSLDAKHRLAIGAPLREQIDPQEDGSSFILVLGPDRHLWLYPDLYYKRLLASLRRSPLPSRQTRRLELLFAMARVVKPDGQGRIVVPEKSMARAVISDEVTLVGLNDHIEIWPRDQWNQHVEESLPSYGELLYEAAEAMETEQGGQG
jgi:MraZ protein